jgi:hypothetical protein
VLPEGEKSCIKLLEIAVQLDLRAARLHRPGKPKPPGNPPNYPDPEEPPPVEEPPRPIQPPMPENPPPPPAEVSSMVTRIQVVGIREAGWYMVKLVHSHGHAT